ncbi:MAG TPA: 3-dehydroquinate synthase family protein [Acidimicrobiales bacterium]|nr:3-dehydroquinate synthase family protein [Acidimicrobiales bacterium]
MIRVPVPLEAQPYEVWVGAGAAALLDEVLPGTAKRVAVVTQPGVPDLARLTGRPMIRHEIGDGEQHKTLATVEDLCRTFARAGLTRTDCVVAVGGGLVTDVAGFAAASYHRGLPVVHLPTTLLGMIDAAIGGKTGVNLPEGKNLVGAFWQPAAVLCDLDALDTLPERELRSGRGEMAKYHFLTGDDLERLPLEERVARCVAIKSAVVVQDEREAPSGTGAKGRAVLNYGHTLAHALEIAGSHDLRHGEAVAVGLVYAAELAGELGRIDRSRIQQHRRVVEGYELAATLPAGSDPIRLVELMRRDKKALYGLTFVLDGPNGVEVVAGVPTGAVEAALERMGACSP